MNSWEEDDYMVKFWESIAIVTPEIRWCLSWLKNGNRVSFVFEEWTKGVIANLRFLSLESREEIEAKFLIGAKFQ